MTTPTKPEVDGQVHWHPKYGWYWPKLTSESYENLKSYGYVIKPVCLITPQEKAQFEALREWSNKASELLGRHYQIAGQSEIATKESEQILDDNVALLKELETILAEGEK